MMASLSGGVEKLNLRESRSKARSSEESSEEHEDCQCRPATPTVDPSKDELTVTPRVEEDVGETCEEEGRGVSEEEEWAMLSQARISYEGDEEEDQVGDDVPDLLYTTYMASKDEEETPCGPGTDTDTEFHFIGEDACVGSSTKCTFKFGPHKGKTYASVAENHPGV